MTLSSPDMLAESATTKTFCNCLAQQRNLDPVGHARAFEDAFILEAPLPWGRHITQQAGTLPQPVIDLLDLWLQQYRAGQGYLHCPLLVAPDPVYSVDGHRRVMFYTQPNGAFAAFDKVEYLAPTDSVGQLIWAWYQDRDSLPRFDRYCVPDTGTTRDLLICTHGAVDAACAKFGYPIYKELRDHYSSEGLRVWRVSHFGGHVFAPTLLEMPGGHYWAYVGPEQAQRIARRTGDAAALRGHYRGWAGLENGFLQAADFALWQRHGWRWLATPRNGTIVAQDDGAVPTWASVRITCQAPPTDRATSIDLRVEVSRQVETEHSTGQDATTHYPQYRVTG